MISVDRQLLLLIQFRIRLHGETTLPRSPVPLLFRSLQEFHEATLSSWDKLARKQGVGGCTDARTTTRRIEIRNFYMCPDRIDFRICRQYLPSAAPSPFQPLALSHFPNYQVPRHSEERIKVLREWGKRERLQSLYKVEVRSNNVLRRRRGYEFEVNLVENVEAVRLEILRFRSHSSTSCRTSRGCKSTGQGRRAVDKAGSERTCKFPRSKKSKLEFRDWPGRVSIPYLPFAPFRCRFVTSKNCGDIVL